MSNTIINYDINSYTHHPHLMDDCHQPPFKCSKNKSVTSPSILLNKNYPADENSDNDDFILNTRIPINDLTDTQVICECKHIESMVEYV